MNKRQKKLLSEISKKAVESDWNIAFGGKSKGNKHLFRVNEISKLLQSIEGGDPFIAQAGAWVHDVSLAIKNDNNPEVIRDYTDEFLSQFADLTNAEHIQIVECATHHETGDKNVSIEAKIVHDSDVIDKSGILGIIRHVWKMTNLIENRILNKSPDVNQIRNHLSLRERRVFTETAKLIVSDLNIQMNNFFLDNKEALKYIKMISEFAMAGQTSDQIANTLVREQDDDIFRFLSSQLDMSYLSTYVKPEQISHKEKVETT